MLNVVWADSGWGGWSVYRMHDTPSMRPQSTRGNRSTFYRLILWFRSLDCVSEVTVSVSSNTKLVHHVQSFPSLLGGAPWPGSAANLLRSRDSASHVTRRVWWPPDGASSAAKSLHCLSSSDLRISSPGLSEEFC